MERLRKLTVALKHLPPAIRTSVEMLPPTIRAEFVAAIEAY
jgi:hypothetical protein